MKPHRDRGCVLRVFRGGTRDGEWAYLHPNAVQAERLARDGSGLTEVYAHTGELEEITTVRQRRDGPIEERRLAEVLELVGSKAMA